MSLNTETARYSKDPQKAPVEIKVISKSKGSSFVVFHKVDILYTFHASLLQLVLSCCTTLAVRFYFAWKEVRYRPPSTSPCGRALAGKPTGL